MAIDLLNPSLGIQGILEPLIDEARLPEARPLVSNASAEKGLDNLFDLSGTDLQIDAALRPDLADDETLRPDVFKRGLREAYELLKTNRHPDVRNFVRQDLAPLMENGELFETYLSLLIGP
ncbi:MAG: type III secretion protein [Deltaproteobacteria bacterium]|jgi:type III secretion protein X|nr:type III secretion protein [Deltaproteobacteria bacterium]